MVATVKFAADDHVAELAVLVGLARLEAAGVDHRDRRLEAAGEALEFAEVRGSRDRDAPGELGRVRRDRAERHQPAHRKARLSQVVQHQVGEQEVPEMVGGHADLVALARAHRLVELRQVDRRVADQRLQRVGAPAVALDEAAHAVERTEVEVHRRDPGRVDAEPADRVARLAEVAAGHHDVPAARRQGLRRLQADAGGGAGDDRRGGVRCLHAGWGP